MINTIQGGSNTITAANTARDGTGTAEVIFDNASGGFGSTDEDIYVDKIVWYPQGANVQTVGRLFANNGNTNATASNNFPLGEITLPEIAETDRAAVNVLVQRVGVWVPVDYRLLVTIGRAVASGYRVSVIAGRYQNLNSQLS